MNPKTSVWGAFRARARGATAVLCSVLIACGDSISFAQNANTGAAGTATISSEQLDSLVAPIALYPDSLLGQVLVASTYPLEIVQLSQWIEKHKNLKPNEVTAAVENQGWDPSIQAMAAFPDVVKNMSENIGWTNDLGNAFLAQQGAVMDAVQRMRTKAMNDGKLQTTQQQTVATQSEAGRTVVVIEPASPDVVYVPTYSPEAIWGAPVYPYPPVYYPPGYAVAASAISFGVGVAIGAAWGGGGWGWRCGWGGNTININNNNAFVRHYNNNTRINGGNRYAGNGNNWQHNPAHRGGAPYGDRNTAQRFGGAARGDNMTNRQNAARQSIGKSQGTASRFGGGNPANGIGTGNRGPGAGNGNGIGNRGPGAGAGVGTGNRGPAAGNGMGNRGPGAGMGAGGRGPAAGGGPGVGGANRAVGGGMGGDRVGNRQTSRPSGGQSPFGGGGMGGFGSRQSSQRGRSSMGGFGGGNRGGGNRGGGMRGGGRRR